MHTITICINIMHVHVYRYTTTNKYFLLRISIPMCSAIMDWVVRKSVVVVTLIILVCFIIYTGKITTRCIN